MPPAPRPSPQTTDSYRKSLIDEPSVLPQNPCYAPLRGLIVVRGQENEMATDSPKGSFVRWQSTTIAQLTYAVNLVLGFSVAALAFQITTLLNKEFNPVSWQKCAFSISLLALMASVGLGIWCVVNRLRDFRVTAKVA